MALKECPKNISPKRWEANKKAGRKGYLHHVRRALILHWADGDGFNWDAAAQHLTGIRRLLFRGRWVQTFSHRRGLTSTTMVEWAQRFGWILANGDYPDWGLL